jgi:hypothetical protein
MVYVQNQDTSTELKKMFFATINEYSRNAAASQ